MAVKLGGERRFAEAVVKAENAPHLPPGVEEPGLLPTAAGGLHFQRRKVEGDGATLQPERKSVVLQQRLHGESPQFMKKLPANEHRLIPQEDAPESRAEVGPQAR